MSELKQARNLEDALEPKLRVTHWLTDSTTSVGSRDASASKKEEDCFANIFANIYWMEKTQ